MTDHTMIALALRVKLLTLAGPTTGGANLAATATGYTRAAGSFLTDGLAPGMEITASGFATAANNGTGLVTAASATALTVVAYTVTVASSAAGYTVAARTLVVEAAPGATTRTVAVLLPALRAWENVSFEPVAGKPWAEEDYVPGPVAQVTVGPLGDVETLPQYVVKLYGPPDQGFVALSRTADAALNLFPPHLALTLTSGDVLRVRGDVAPYKGQLRQLEGYAVITVTVPLRIRSRNTL